MMLFFSTYKRWIEIAAIGLVIIGVLWVFHSWSEKQREVGRKEIRLEWREAEIKRVEAENKLLAAQNAVRDMAKTQGEEREKIIASASAATNAAVVSMRSTIANQQTQLATASIETTRRYSAAAGTVLAECFERYSTVGKDAARLDNAARTLNDAWPTAPPAVAK